LIILENVILSNGRWEGWKIGRLEDWKLGYILPGFQPSIFYQPAMLPKGSKWAE
jgi:hypothetical protein